MATYTVTPLPDGVDMRSNWQLKKNGSRLQPYTKKQTAIDAAYSKGSKGDTLVIVRTDGTIQDQRTIEGGSSDADTERVMPFGERWARESAEKSTGFDWL